MSTPQKESSSPFDKTAFKPSLHYPYRRFLKAFKKTSKFYPLFQLSFFTIFLAELSAFFLFFTLLTQSSLLAFTIGGIFLSSFFYLVLLFYFQMKKPEQFIELRNRFIAACKKTLTSSEKDPQYHLFLAQAVNQLVSYLQGFEWSFYKPPRFLSGFSPLCEKVSTYFHWEDVIKIKELLLYASIDEHIKQIKLNPSDLQAHSYLANSYVQLSKIYKEPKKYAESFFIRSLYKKNQETLDYKFELFAGRAVEELKILYSYAPNDPAVHKQLARSYNALGMKEKEAREYEILLKLRPQDKNILLRLGVLYFELGLNAKGLKVYESLKKTNRNKAEELLSFYGSYRVQDLFEETLSG